MIKRKVILRSDAYDIYSSEQQERMKVYFQLNEKFSKCVSNCKLIPDNPECEIECERIYDDYAKLLKTRYEGDRKELIDVKVKDLPTFDRIKRNDRGWLYSVFGQDYHEIFGDAPKGQEYNPHPGTDKNENK